MTLTAFLPNSLLETSREPERKHPGPVPLGILEYRQQKKQHLKKKKYVCMYKANVN